MHCWFFVMQISFLISIWKYLNKHCCNIFTGRTYNSATGLICLNDNGPYNPALLVTLSNIV